MKKKIRLEGLCCANCAAKIEEKVGKIAGVDACTVNFLTEKMIIEIADESVFETLRPAIEKAALKIEPDVTIKYI